MTFEVRRADLLLPSVARRDQNSAGMNTDILLPGELLREEFHHPLGMFSVVIHRRRKPPSEARYARPVIPDEENLPRLLHRRS